MKADSVLLLVLARMQANNSFRLEDNTVMGKAVIPR